MSGKELQLYLHIPFCIRKCAYCDFLSFPAPEEVRKEYVRVLISQIKQSQEKGRPVTTVFLGGGTPSVLESAEIAGIMEAIRESFRLKPGAEVTMETNPGTLDREKLEAYRAAGVNRLSIGLQSTEDGELKLLGRIHSFDQFLENYESARQVGFDNLNIDLMSALPGQTIESWRRTLRQVLELEPEHISAYSLIVEEGTPFYERYREEVKRREQGSKCTLLPSEEEERQMYEDTERILGKAGYGRYEISNYARPGYECRHNIGYWRRADYLGLGLGASSLIGTERFQVTGDIKAYLKGDFTKKERIFLSKKEEMEEFMFLGLRLREGILRDAFEEEFGISYQQIYGKVSGELEEEGLLEVEENEIRLTRRGIDVSNYVLAQFLL